MGLNRNEPVQSLEAREPAVGYASDIGPALNAASNRVAVDVADWIAGS